jgi:hypothetical protein
MAIYTRQPYFYIIQETKTGRFYAGSKIAADADPSKFMIEGGYTTSSKYINSIIESEGLSSFSIITLLVFDSPQDAYDAETTFLNENKCKTSPSWLNGHNNNLLCFGTEEYYNTMEKIYGSRNIMDSQIVKDKIVNTLLSRYGVTNAFNSPKTRETMMERYGVEYPLQSEAIKNKCKKTCLEKYGTINPSSSQYVKDKRTNKFQEKYGVSNPSQIPEIKEKRSEDKSNLASRDIVSQIKLLNGEGKKRKIKLGRGWYFRSNSYLRDILLQLQ